MNVFSMRASLEIAASEAKFFKEFFVSLDFFFVTFFCIKTKESKVDYHDYRRKRHLTGTTTEALVHYRSHRCEYEMM
jgi:hypothetical protein